MLNKKLNIRVLRHSLMIASTISVLTGCDYFTDNGKSETAHARPLVVKEMKQPSFLMKVWSL